MRDVLRPMSQWDFPSLIEIPPSSFLVVIEINLYSLNTNISHDFFSV